MLEPLGYPVNAQPSNNKARSSLEELAQFLTERDLMFTRFDKPSEEGDFQASAASLAWLTWAAEGQ